MSRQSPDLQESLQQPVARLDVLWDDLQADADRLTLERQHFLDVFQGSPDPLLMTDCDGAILEANAAAGELLRIPLCFLRRKPLAAFVALQQRPAFRVALLAFRNGTSTLRSWHIDLRPRKGPGVKVAASVSTTGADPGTARAFYWVLRAG